MPRPLRFAPIGVPQHVVQRGNNRQACFKQHQDYCFYASLLKKHSAKYQVDIHAWVFMTNHIHLLCTPRKNESISLMMQCVSAQYSRYFNNMYQRTGTLWEGRFRACLVEAENYLFTLYFYIELNPVRAGMVKHPSQYKWSSYAINTGAVSSSLCTPHPLFYQLGNNSLSVKAVYKNMLEQQLLQGTSQTKLTHIKKAYEQGRAIGTESFLLKMESITGNNMSPS